MRFLTSFEAIPEGLEAQRVEEHSHENHDKQIGAFLAVAQ